MSPIKGIEKAIKTALKAGQWRQAGDLCRELLEHDPRRVEFRHHLATTEFNLHRTVESLAICDDVLRDPDCDFGPQTRLLRARALAALNRLPEAFDAYRDLVARHPDFPKGLMDAATFFQHNGSFHEGLACLDIYRARFPQTQPASAVFKRSWFLQSLGDMPQAFETLIPLLPAQDKDEYDTNEANALVAAGRLELRQGQFLRAQKRFHQVLHSPLTKTGLRSLASFWQMHTNPLAARDYFRQLWREQQGAEDFAHIVDCYVNEANLPAATRLFNGALLRALSTNPVDGEWLARLCAVHRSEFGSRELVHEQLGDNAAEIFDTALAAIYLSSRKNVQETKAAARKLLSLSPGLTHPEALLHGLNGNAARGNAAIRAALKNVRDQQTPYTPEPVDVHVVATLAVGGLERRLARNVLAQTGRRQVICVQRTDHPDRDALMRMVGEHPNVEVIELSHYADRDDLGLQERFAEQPGLIEIPQLAACASMLREVRPARLFAWGVQTFDTVASAAYIVHAPQVIIHDGSVAPTSRTLMTPVQLGRFQYIGDLLQQFLMEDGWSVVCNAPRNVADYRVFVGGDVPADRFQSCPMLFPREITTQQAGLASEELRAKLGIAADAPVIAFFGRLSKEKNLALWLQTAQIVAAYRPDVAFLIVGDGQAYFTLRSLARRLGIADRIRFAGRQNLSLRSFYAITDVYLSTSDYEGLPNTLLEAQALGVPVVVRNAGGAGDAFAPNETGILVDASEPEPFAHGLLSLIDNRALRDQMAARGPVFIRQNTRETNFALTS